MKRSVDRAAGASSSKDREPHERLGGRRFAAEPRTGFGRRPGVIRNV